MADVSVEALIGSLADTTAFNELKKRIERVTQNAKPLDTPAARVIEERALRKVRDSAGVVS
jgi:precorrin-6B methylase 2